MTPHPTASKLQKSQIIIAMVAAIVGSLISTTTVVFAFGKFQGGTERDVTYINERLSTVDKKFDQINDLMQDSAKQINANAVNISAINANYETIITGINDIKIELRELRKQQMELMKR